MNASATTTHTYKVTLYVNVDVPIGSGTLQEAAQQLQNLVKVSVLEAKYGDAFTLNDIDGIAVERVD